MSSAIQELEAERAEMVKIVDLRNKALKLADNPEFKELILSEFLEKEPARLAIIAEDPNLDDRQQRDCKAMAFAPGHLKRFLSITVVRGNTAENRIHGIDEEIAELRANPNLDNESAE